MVAKQLRTVSDPHSRCVVASKYEDGDRPANEGGDLPADLPSRTGGTSRPAHTEARAELRDRETYYAELRFAVHCQSRSIPAPRAAMDDSAHHDRAHHDSGGTESESWDEMIARLGDTWT
jgi:hypothetical protein